MLYIYEVLMEVLKETPISNKVSEILKEILYRRSEDSRSLIDKINDGNSPILINLLENNNICCFSLEKDELSLWNYYTKSETKTATILVLIIRICLSELRS